MCDASTDGKRSHRELVIIRIAAGGGLRYASISSRAAESMRSTAAMEVTMVCATRSSSRC
jgi:hypothetical protein